MRRNRKPAKTPVSKQRRRNIGDEIIAGLTEAVETLERGETLEKRFRVRTVEVPDAPTPYDAASVLATRARLHATQAMFASLMGVSTVLVQAWEQGKRKPSLLACRLLDEMNREPERWAGLLRPSRALLHA